MNHTEIIKYLTGQLSLEKKNNVERWINESEDNRQTFLEYEKLYKLHLPIVKKYNSDLALRNINERIEQFDAISIETMVQSEVYQQSSGNATRAYPNKSRKTDHLHAHIGRYRKNSALWMKIAASIFLAVTILAIYTYNISIQIGSDLPEPVAGRLIVTNPGEQLTVRLVDGTRIMVNSGSEIYIPADFGSQERSVSIKGEAFFEVSPDELPFIVRNETSQIKVLGTSFSVRSWADRNESVVAVQSGLVEVRSSNPEITDSVQLSKGQFAIVQSNSIPELYRSGDIGQYVGWTTNEMIFTNTPLRDVIMRLELQFNVQISISDSTVLGDPVTARYKNETLEEILKFTTITHGIEFTISTQK